MKILEEILIIDDVVPYIKEKFKLREKIDKIKI